ncbi:hypothetical protein TraAM80_05257 [Trypanosoma rangeli]|uniref:Uncharacterized protein n=1 Tax=Trypanosoma rangeli TaxID=5698 RepID=A0A422NFY9_TRYRA|nr:uncharacterized protein TraAM80_05257 [Trypanosoma rangeli]RNF04378.1 hypothetical protein TraAM80_05257 [Trypanosoma rangeli]|eukprot:RNF04378.1 hypothetical protein TraAM80_05257 [Trypanosoma rangeli]
MPSANWTACFSEACGGGYDASARHTHREEEGKPTEAISRECCPRGERDALCFFEASLSSARLQGAVVTEQARSISHGGQAGLTPLSLSPVSLPTPRMMEAGDGIEAASQLRRHIGAVAGLSGRGGKNGLEEVPSLSLSGQRSPVSSARPHDIELPATLAYEETNGQHGQEAHQQEAFPLTALRYVCEQIGRVLERQETSFRELDARVSRRNSSASQLWPEENPPAQEFQGELVVADDAPASPQERGFSCSQARSERQQQQREEMANTTLAVNQTTRFLASPRMRSVTGCRPFTAAPVSSYEMTGEEERLVLEQAQQQEPQLQQRAELHESVAGVAVNDAQDVITLHPNVNCLVFDASATPCPSLSPFSASMKRGPLLPVAVPILQIESISSVSISPLSRPLSAFEESPTFSRREGFALQGTSAQLQLPVQQMSVGASRGEAAPRVPPTSFCSCGVGEGVASIGHTWSAPGVMDLSFNRTPKHSLNSSPSYQAQESTSTRNTSISSDVVLAYSLSTDSLAHGPTEQEWGEEKMPSPRGVATATAAAVAAAASNTIPASGTASRETLLPVYRVPPVQTMRRPPTVPQRTVPLDVPMRDEEVCNSDEEALSDAFSGEELNSRVSDGEDDEKGDGDAWMRQWQVHQRLF